MHAGRRFVNKVEYKRLKGLNYTDKQVAKMFGVSESWIIKHKKELVS